jgi:hypothetical protein
MRTILAILAIGLFSLSANAQADFQMCSTDHGLEVCLTMNTSTKAANVVMCPIGGSVNDCDIWMGSVQYNSYTKDVTFTNSKDGTRVLFGHYSGDVYQLVAGDYTWFLNLTEL